VYKNISYFCLQCVIVYQKHTQTDINACVSKYKYKYMKTADLILFDQQGSVQMSALQSKRLLNIINWHSKWTSLRNVSLYTQGQSPEPKIREYFYYIDHEGMVCTSSYTLYKK